MHSNRLFLVRRGRGARVPDGTCRVLAERLRRAMRAAGLRGVELSVTLSDNRELHALNRTYAGEDHATDVLSFSQREAGEVPGALEGGSAREALGDVIISVEYAARQAKGHGHALPGELFHLAVHGLVHLCGYDHRSKPEERTMFGYEAALRAAALERGVVRKVSAPRTGTARPPSVSGRRLTDRPRGAHGKVARPRPTARARRLLR